MFFASFACLWQQRYEKKVNYPLGFAAFFLKRSANYELFCNFAA
jgi:hypothetical protein